MSAPPRYSPAPLAGKIKGGVGSTLAVKFPKLRKKGHIWSRSYFCASTGTVSTEVIRQYIETQWGRIKWRTSEERRSNTDCVLHWQTRKAPLKLLDKGKNVYNLALSECLKAAILYKLRADKEYQELLSKRKGFQQWRHLSPQSMHSWRRSEVTATVLRRTRKATETCCPLILERIAVPVSKE